jgi:hypothetical protein
VKKRKRTSTDDLSTVDLTKQALSSISEAEAQLSDRGKATEKQLVASALARELQALGWGTLTRIRGASQLRPKSF